jgi:hypothetical protein
VVTGTKSNPIFDFGIDKNALQEGALGRRGGRRTVSWGAQGTDDEVEQVIAYLASNFGRGPAGTVNINKAGATDLATALGNSAADASAIVSCRSDKGQFQEPAGCHQGPGN